MKSLYCDSSLFTIKWAYSSSISLTAPRVEGSKQAVSSSFSSRTYRQQTGVKKLRLQAVARRKAGAAKAGAATTFVSKAEWLRERRKKVRRRRGNVSTSFQID